MSARFNHNLYYYCACLLLTVGTNADGPVQSLAGHTVSEEEHPLTLASESKWNTYFEDREVLE